MRQPCRVPAPQSIGVGALGQAGILAAIGDDIVNKRLAHCITVAVRAGGKHPHLYRHVDVVGLRLRHFHLRGIKGYSLHVSLPSQAALVIRWFGLFWNVVSNSLAKISSIRSF